MYWCFSFRDCWKAEVRGELHRWMNLAIPYPPMLSGGRSIFVTGKGNKRKCTHRGGPTRTNHSASSVKLLAGEFKWLFWVKMRIIFGSQCFVDFVYRNANAKTPDYFEDLFCSLNCCEEYHLRTNNRSIRNVCFHLYFYLNEFCSCKKSFSCWTLVIIGAFQNWAWHLHKLPTRLPQTCGAHQSIVNWESRRVYRQSCPKFGKA